MIRLQKLSVDFTKASEALRLWALNEGDDLAVGDLRSLPPSTAEMTLPGHTQCLHKSPLTLLFGTVTLFISRASDS